MALSSSIEHAVPKQPNRHSANSWIAKADEDIDTVDLLLSASWRHGGFLRDMVRKNSGPGFRASKYNLTFSTVLL